MFCCCCCCCCFFFNELGWQAPTLDNCTKHLESQTRESQCEKVGQTNCVNNVVFPLSNQDDWCTRFSNKTNKTFKQICNDGT